MDSAGQCPAAHAGMVLDLASLVGTPVPFEGWAGISPKQRHRNILLMDTTK